MLRSSQTLTKPTVFTFYVPCRTQAGKQKVAEAKSKAAADALRESLRTKYGNNLMIFVDGKQLPN